MATQGPDAPPSKRLRGSHGAIVNYQEQDEESKLRTSSLPSPTLQLRGHAGSVYSVQYSPNGETLCSASFDKTCLLWSHADYENFNVLTGHKNAVLDVTWCDDDTVATASADKMVMVWDVATGTRLRKWQQHSGIVNAVAKTQAGVASVSDDGICLLWDRRQKSSVGALETPYPLLAVAATDTNVYTAGIDSNITCWDLKMMKKVYAMQGHTEPVTCLALHPEGTHLLSNSMDHSLRSWDIGAYCAGNRLCKTFVGHKHNAEKGLLKCAWNASGNMVTAGSADKMVHIWDEFSQEELYLLPGHKGCVNAVTFHPTENIVCSGASDKQIFVGELS